MRPMFSTYRMCAMQLVETRPAGLDRAQRRFVDDFGQCFARSGLTLTFGRVFGLLLMSDDPLSLDDLAGQLGVSKSGISVATRDLERLGLAHRLGTPGSRRVRYEANDDCEPLFEAQFARVRQQFSTLRRADGLLAPGAAKRRLHELLALHDFWLQESTGILARWRQRRHAQ